MHPSFVVLLLLFSTTACRPNGETHESHGFTRVHVMDRGYSMPLRVWAAYASKIDEQHNYIQSSNNTELHVQFSINDRFEVDEVVLKYEIRGDDRQWISINVPLPSFANHCPSVGRDQKNALITCTPSEDKHVIRHIKVPSGSDFELTRPYPAELLRLSIIGKRAEAEDKILEKFHLIMSMDDGIILARVHSTSDNAHEESDENPFDE